MASRSQHRVWWLTEVDGHLVLRKDFDTYYNVRSVNTGLEKKTLSLCLSEKDQPSTIIRINVELDCFRAVDTKFRDLVGVKSRSEFQDKLHEIMDRNALLISDAIDDPSEDENEREVSLVGKNPYKHKLPFFQEVVMMRNLHPDKEDEDFLPRLNKGRQACKHALDFNEKHVNSTFSASFREQIFAATLPRHCFHVIEDIQENFKAGKIKTAYAKGYMSSGFLQPYVGLYNKERLLSALVKVNEGQITLKEFRVLGKQLKEQEKEKRSDKTKDLQDELCLLRREVHELRKENADLRVQLEQRTQEQTEGEAEFSVGDAVVAYWEPDSTWYDATIIKVNKSGYRVEFDMDMIRETVPRKFVKTRN